MPREALLSNLVPIVHVRITTFAMPLLRYQQIRQVSAESIAEKQRRISGQDAAAEAGRVHELEDEVQRLRNDLADKEEVKIVIRLSSSAVLPPLSIHAISPHWPRRQRG